MTGVPLTLKRTDSERSHCGPRTQTYFPEHSNGVIGTADSTRIEEQMMAFLRCELHHKLQQRPSAGASPGATVATSRGSRKGYIRT